MPTLTGYVGCDVGQPLFLLVMHIRLHSLFHCNVRLLTAKAGRVKNTQGILKKRKCLILHRPEAFWGTRSDYPFLRTLLSVFFHCWFFLLTEAAFPCTQMTSFLLPAWLYSCLFFCHCVVCHCFLIPALFRIFFFNGEGSEQLRGMKYAWEIHVEIMITANNVI